MNKNNVLVHKIHGLCEIIDEIEMGGKKYFKVRVFNESSLVIYCPIDKKDEILRPLLTKDEADDLLRYMKTITEVEYDFSKKRRTLFKEMYYSGDIKNIAYLARVLFLLKEYKKEKNQDLGLEDNKIFENASKMLHDEFAVVYDINRENIEEFINKRIEKL